MRRTVVFASAIAATSCAVERDVEPEPSGVAIDDATEAFRTEFCERRAECCSPFDVPSVAECAMAIDEQIQFLREIAEEEPLTYDPSCWESIIERLRDVGCATEPEDVACAPPCAPFHGDQEIGEYCRVLDANLSDCAQGLVCTPQFCETSECKDVCRDPCQRAQLGERCLDIPCAEGLSCDVMLDECVPTPAIGEPCVWGSGCGEGAMCDDATNTCVAGADAEDPDALGPPGTPCNSWRQCRSGSCPAGFCAALPGPGEPCSLGCADGFECSMDTFTCVEPAPSICTADPL